MITKHGLVLLIFRIAICDGKGLKMFYNVTDSEYDEMPQLFKLDDFDECMNKPNTLYCYTTVQLSPVNQSTPSRVWNIIQEVISVPRTYRHDRIRHGICVPSTCPGVPNTHYQVGSNLTQPLLDALAKCFSDKYNHLGLQGHVIKIHCENETPFHQIDQLDMIYACIVLSILALVVASSFYEGFARFLEPSKYEELTTKTALGRFITCFSLPKNWERLRSEVKSNDALALAPIQGTRVINTILVVFSHTALTFFVTPVINPRYLEDITLKLRNMLPTNGTLICQTFFIVSGLLSMFAFRTNFANKKVQIKDLFYAIVYRIFRLVPLILLIVGFNATWLRHINRGPIWEPIVGDEFRNCRKNWVWNVAFLNNYINPSNMCLMQTWFMAADMQVFIFGLLVTMYVLNNPKHANKVFISSIIFGITLTFCTDYYYDLDIMMRVWPETLYSLLLENDNFLMTYIVAYNQIPCHVIGLAAGYHFYDYHKTNKPFITSKNFYNNIFKFWLFAWTVFIGTFVLGSLLIISLFHAEGFDPSRMCKAIYAALIRTAFGLPVALLIFGFITGIGWRMRSVCAWGPFQYLGRLSFTAFLVHSIPLRIRTALTRSLLYGGDLSLAYATAGDVTVSYILATLVCLCFELPLSALQKIFSQGTPKVNHIKMNGKSD